MKKTLIIAGIVLMAALSFQPVVALDSNDDRVAKKVDPEPGG